MPGVLGATPKIDTTDFQNGIKQMNSALRALDTGFKASAASLGDWSKDATGLEKRIDTLQQRLIAHKQKVDTLREAYEKARQETGETSIKTLDAATAYNRAAEALNKDEKELNDTTTALSKMKSGSNEAGDSVKKLGDVLHGIGAAGKVAVAGIVALGTTAVFAVGALGALTVKASDYGSEIADLSVKTGIGTTELQEMKYTAEILGVSFETLTGAQSKLTRSMATAEEQQAKFNNELASGKMEDEINVPMDMAAAFNQLGVSVIDARGNLRSTKDVFDDAIVALGKIQNPAERDALTMQIFGKNATELNAIIKAGPEGLAKYAEEAHKLGAVLDEDGIKKLDEFGDSLSGLKLGFQGVMASIALAFLPGMQGVVNQGKDYLIDLVKVVQGSGGDVGKMAEGLGALFGRIVTDLAKQAPQMLQTGLTLVKSVLSSITSALPTMLPAAISIIKSLVEFIVQNLPMLLNAGIQILLTLLDAIIQNLPMLIGAALQAIITLANGLTLALPTLIPAMVQAILTIVVALLDNLPLIVDAALHLILALADGLVAALPLLRDDAIGGKVMPALLDALAQIIPALFIAGAELLIALAGGLVASIRPEILKFGSAFLEEMLFQKAMWVIRAVQMGKDFIQGLIDGIISAAGGLYDAVAGIVNTMLDTVTGSSGLDQQSPSKKGRAIGANFTNSLALGGQDALRSVIQSYIGMTGQLAAATAAGMNGSAGAVSTSSVSSEYNAYYAPVTVVSSQQVRAAEDAAKGRRF